MQGNVIVEQVEADGEVVRGRDTSLSRKELFQKIKCHFPNIDQDSTGIYGEYMGKRYAIRAKNVTYLGIPHDHYKKRIQIPRDLQEFYRNALEDGRTPILLGVYSQGDATLFCEFNIVDFVKKKANNSSAHVYTTDLSAAAVDGFFQKWDYFGNKITVFRPDMVQVFLDQLFGISDDAALDDIFHAMAGGMASGGYHAVSEDEDDVPKQPAGGMPAELLEVFLGYFRSVDKVWMGKECYQKMIADQYRNKFQPEWAGFYLEYDFEKYLKKHALEHLVAFAQDKKKGGIDLDLEFPTIKAYGDLKAHSCHSRGIQGNDWDTVMKLIETKDSHVYYIVCEHSTQKDQDRGYEVTEFWNRAQNKKNLRSYASRMKHSVTLEKMYILDINQDNAGYLTVFRQGVNSNGKLRKPKIMIEQDQLSHFAIVELEF